TGLISGTISTTADSGSPYTATVTASHGNYSNSQTFTWTVSHLAVTNPGDQTSADGAVISLPISASDASAHTLTYSAANLPTGVTINSSTGLISGTIAAGAPLSSPYAATVAASDGTLSTSQTFNWTITPQVALTTPAEQSNLEGDT